MHIHVTKGGEEQKDLNLLPRDMAVFQRMGIPRNLLEAADVQRVTDAEARDGRVGAGEMGCKEKMRGEKTLVT